MSSGFFPFVSVGGSIVPTYFFAIGLASAVAVMWTALRARRRGLDEAFAQELMLVMMVAGFVGGRALHVIYEAPEYYWAAPTRAFRFWEGGFVYFGGFALAFVAGAALARARHQIISVWADFFSPIGALAYALGRVACWMTGCCYGRACAFGDGPPFQFPTQVFAVVFELFAMACLLAFERSRSRGMRARPGAEFALWMALHGAGRLAMEIFRGDDRGPALFGASLSSWIAVALIVGAGLWARLPNGEEIDK